MIKINVTYSSYSTKEREVIEKIVELLEQERINNKSIKDYDVDFKFCPPITINK